MANDNQINYFGYASNLKTSVLESRIGNSIADKITGRLIDYGFRFNRRNEDGTARANILVSESEDVFGVIYRINEKNRDVLLKTEPGYHLILVSVETDFGIEQAHTFISDEDTEGIYPEAGYLKTIVQGAKEHRIPEEYIDFIKSLAK